MDFSGPEFIVALIALSTFGWLANNWIRARHGYALEDEWGGKTARAESDEAAGLRRENAELKALLAKVDSRMQVLERIVTDKGYETAAQIEALREIRAPDTGAPLGLEEPERA